MLRKTGPDMFLSTEDQVTYHMDGVTSGLKKQFCTENHLILGIQENHLPKGELCIIQV